jgi:hypothetical protein
MDDVGIFYRHWVAFTVFCYIFWTFGIVRGNLAYFFPFWFFVRRKIWQPWPQRDWLAGFCFNYLKEQCR